jgi:Dolichyl-phosphate-mannose-protein mannosyltransferase
MGAQTDTSIAKSLPFAERPILWLFGILALAAFARAIFFAGFFGSDDIGYATRGAEIASGIWRPSQAVGELRYGINIPISVFVRVLGTGDIAFSAWSLVCSLAEIGLVFVVAREVWGVKAAVLSGVVMALAPIHIILGSSPLADAPLAFLFSLALTSFFFAERSGKRWLYVITGVAAGLSWWVKPHAAAPFVMVFAVYALVWRAWRREWLLVILAGACVVGLELAMFWAKFGDPLYAIKAMRSGLSANYIDTKAEPLWGSTSLFFYFRQMFLDGRDMWIAPYLAVAGLLLLARTRLRDHKIDFGSGYVSFWALSLLGIFSFFIYSVNPLRFIPKQDNYALMFFAPIALLAGFALSRMSGTLLAVTICVFAVGAMSLSALEAYAVSLHYSALKKTVSFAEEHPDARVFASHQAIGVAKLANLAAGRNGAPENLVPIGVISAPQDERPPPMSPSRYAIADPSTPELVKPEQAGQIGKVLAQCWQQVGTLSPEADGVGRHVVRFLSWLRPQLPTSVDRYLSFTNNMIVPRAATIFRFNPDSCEKRSG